MTDPNRIRLSAAHALAVFIGSLGACTTQDATSTPAVPITVISVPPQRSYLDAGPAPSSGGANYTRPGVGGLARQTDAFGSDVVPRIP